MALGIVYLPFRHMHATHNAIATEHSECRRHWQVRERVQRYSRQLAPQNLRIST